MLLNHHERVFEPTITIGQDRVVCLCFDWFDQFPPGTSQEKMGDVCWVSQVPIIHWEECS